MRCRRFVLRVSLPVAFLALTALAHFPAETLSQAKKRPGGPSGFELFSGPVAFLNGNQFTCGVDELGDICANVFNSPFGAGGLWPGLDAGYVFNSGLQFAGRNSSAAGPWAGDTVAAYIFDTRGSQQHSTSLGPVFDSRNPEDLENWPPEAVVTDAGLFEPALLGRPAASQQDSWTQYWDGDPARNRLRKHPMGIRVTQRTLAWNYPLGNESIIYFLFDIANVTADPEFQRLNELEFFAGSDALPDGGWSIDSVYVAYTTDFDVTKDATLNYSTPIFPFDMGISYHGEFPSLGLTFRPRFFKHPFFSNASGIVGARFLKTALDPATGRQLGLTNFSTFSGASTPGAQFVDPVGDDQLWRYLSGRLDPSQGDPPCDTAPPVTPEERHLCFVFQVASDTRFFQATGPFSLDAGETQTIALALTAAATVKLLPDGTPSGIQANAASTLANQPGIASMHPGFASRRGCDLNGLNCSLDLTAAQNPVKPIEHGAGWVAYTGPAPSGALERPANKLDPFAVEVIPESLLGKALVAQTLFNNRFLLPAPPAPPPFHLVQGDGRVTVVWSPSPSEKTGDPFFPLASNPGGALFNPNYRGSPGAGQPHGDVEGYRVWKGTDPDSLELIAQFDYADTRFLDFTCETVAPDEDVGARRVTRIGDTLSVVGYASGELCPLDSAPLVRSIGGHPRLVFNNGGAGGAPGAGVRRLETLAADPFRLDTIQTSGPSRKFSLHETGVPFVFVDDSVRNNFTLFYTVTAFDVNSPTSGPLSLESRRIVASTVPRADSPNLKLAQFTSSMSGDDGAPLDPAAPVPALDPEDGTFSGPFPPTDGFDLSFAPLVEQLLPAFSLSATIDSVAAVFTAAGGSCPNGANAFGACWKMFLTANLDGAVSQQIVQSYTPWWSAFGEPAEVADIPVLTVAVPFDPVALQTFGIPSGSGEATVRGRTVEAIDMSASQGPQARRFPSFKNGGSRWFDGDPRAGDNERTPDPTRLIRVGHLAAADTVWSPISHTAPDIGQAPPGGQVAFEKQCFSRAISFLGREADVTFTWGGDTFAEVRDVTHHVDVPFSPKASTSWGFLTTDANGNGLLDWQDFNFIDGALQQIRGITGGNCDAAAGTAFDPSGAAIPVRLTRTASIGSTSTDGLDQPGISGLVQTGAGFGLYVDGERFIFELGSLPASGTTWTLRSYHGGVRTSGGTQPDPSGYQYTLDVARSGLTRSTRPVLIPGLTFHFDVAAATAADPAATDLARVHAVPDPYLGHSSFDLSPVRKQLLFVNLPPEATLRIYTLTGVLVDIIRHSDPSGGGRATWDLRNRGGRPVASGVYFFHVLTPGGEEHVGKFTVINGVGS